MKLEQGAVVLVGLDPTVEGRETEGIAALRRREHDPDVSRPDAIRFWVVPISGASGEGTLYCRLGGASGRVEPSFGLVDQVRFDGQRRVTRAFGASRPRSFEAIDSVSRCSWASTRAYRSGAIEGLFDVRDPRRPCRARRRSDHRRRGRADPSLDDVRARRRRQLIRTATSIRATTTRTATASRRRSPRSRAVRRRRVRVGAGRGDGDLPGPAAGRPRRRAAGHLPRHGQRAGSTCSPSGRSARASST